MVNTNTTAIDSAQTCDTMAQGATPKTSEGHDLSQLEKRIALYEFLHLLVRVESDPDASACARPSCSLVRSDVLN